VLIRGSGFSEFNVNSGGPQLAIVIDDPELSTFRGLEENVFDDERKKTRPSNYATSG
jgi:hypothetical protein